MLSIVLIIILTLTAECEESYEYESDMPSNSGNEVRRIALVWF